MTDFLYDIAFQRITFNYPQAAITLLNALGNARNIYDNRHDIRSVTPEASNALCTAIATDWHSELKRAEKEIMWCEKNKISVLIPHMDSFPQRLKNCSDCPTALYYRGTADCNAPYIISIVGTRQSTPYGHDFIHRFISDLHEMLPEAIVVSGLAYGIDVCAHREALEAGTDTIGVLAHGLDTMYPAVHRNIAAKMLEQGGLLTEYISETPGERANFLRRNRIVAGMADCTVVVESMSHGGSLVTANIALGYGREVMALPGNINNAASKGCNKLIRKQQATLITSAQDLIDTMAWQSMQKKKELKTKGIQTSLFQNLSPEQTVVIEHLKNNDTQINILSNKTNIPISKLTAILFELEMMGIVKPLAGGMFHLIV